MKLKTYRADTMKEARMKVKMDLGKEARILETRRVQEGGFFGFLADTVIEVDAAVPPVSHGSGPGNSSRDSTRSSKSGSRPSNRTSNGQQKQASSAPNRSQSNSNGFEKSVNEPVEPNFSPREQATQLIQEKEAGNNSSDHTYKRPKPDEVENGNADKASDDSSKNEDSPISSEKLTRVLENTDRLTEKIDELASALDEEEASSHQGGEGFPGELTSAYRNLLDEGVEAEHARELIARVRRQLEADEVDNPDRIKACLKQEISSDISVADPLRTDRDETLLLPFVGPTGVGKTTTMAKLAAYFSVEEGQNVSFITFDTYRLAAVEQLRCYADILQVPVEAVMSEEEFKETLEEFKAETDIVFVDTAGRSQFDDDKIGELEKMIDSEQSVITHLVVDATSRSEDLDSILEGFERVGYDRIVVTKLDETRYHGTIFNLARRSSAPLSYFTNGQDVPDDLSRLEPDEIASLVLGDELDSFEVSQPAETSGV